MAITGVISSNNVAWEWVDEEICPTCEHIEREIKECDTCPECGGDLITKNWIENDGEYIECEECGQEYDIDEQLEFIECFDHEKLIGDWQKNKDGLWEPNENGEFSAIVTSSTFNCVQVIRSKYTTKVKSYCSPCFPNQADLDSGFDEDGIECYTLPEELISRN